MQRTLVMVKKINRIKTGDENHNNESKSKSEQMR